MNKNSLLILAIILTISVLFAGKWHYDNKIEAQGQAAYATYKQDTEQQDLLDSLNPELNPKQSVFDYLHYKSLTQDRVNISLLGSSGTAGMGSSDSQYTWGHRLEAQLHSLGEEFEKVQVHIHGFPKYSTARLVKEAKVRSITNDTPDLVIFETALFHNYDQHVPMDKTKEDIEAVFHSIQKNAPGAKILLSSSNPVSVVSEENTENYIGYTYNDYIKETTTFIEDKGWAYVNIHNEMTTRIANENIKLSSILTQETYPVDDGYLIWYEELFEYLEKNHDNTVN